MDCRCYENTECYGDWVRYNEVYAPAILIESVMVCDIPLSSNIQLL